MKDIFDLAEWLADKHPDATWLEVQDGSRRLGFKIARGKGLELTVDIYSLK